MDYLNDKIVKIGELTALLLLVVAIGLAIAGAGPAPVGMLFMISGTALAYVCDRAGVPSSDLRFYIVVGLYACAIALFLANKTF